MNNSNRIPSYLISRDPNKEAIFGIKSITYYAYKDSNRSMTIVGQIFADQAIKHDFSLILTIYDKYGDVVRSEKSRSYGAGIVTNMIKAQSFFDGFPFKFHTYNVNWNVISKITITPTEYQ